jgi:hypothetical protein
MMIGGVGNSLISLIGSIANGSFIRDCIIFQLNNTNKITDKNINPC